MKILVVYSGFTRRPTILQGLLCYEKYSSYDVYYLNARYSPVLQGIAMGSHFDIIIFSTLFFSRRTEKDALLADFESVAWLKSVPGLKIATPQDEYINSKYVNEFIDDFGVRLVFSVQPKSVMHEVYPLAEQRGFEVKQILTGYIDDELADQFSIEKKWMTKERKIDIGYRTTGVPPAWYGRHAMLKSQIAYEFLNFCKNSSLTLDIDPTHMATISNDSWYDFLGNCRFTIGVEGGTSIIDFDGSIKEATENYIKQNPLATFSEIEANCFPSRDGEFKGYALSPRHLEACLTRTAQILVKGDYSGVLKPWRHYIPLEKDFSNINQSISLLSDDKLRLAIVERCFEDIVKSNKFRTSTLVNYIINSCLPFIDIGASEKMEKYKLNKLLRKISKPGGIVFTIVDNIRSLRNKFKSLC